MSQRLVIGLALLAIVLVGVIAYLAGRGSVDEDAAYERGRLSGLVQGRAAGETHGAQQGLLRTQDILDQCGPEPLVRILTADDPLHEPVGQCDPPQG